MSHQLNESLLHQIQIMYSFAPSEEMEFISGKKLQAITCSYSIHDKVVEDPAKHFKTGNAKDSFLKLWIFVFLLASLTLVKRITESSRAERSFLYKFFSKRNSSREHLLCIPSASQLRTFKLCGLYMVFPPRASLYPAVWLITWRMVSTWWDRQGGQAGQQSACEQDDTDCKHA